MAYSYINYTGDGSKAGPFSIPFPYLDRTHVHFYVQGMEVTSMVEWLSDSSINLPSVLLEGETLSIVRITQRDARLVVYQDGSLLDEGTLNLDSTQLFYVMQEALDTLGRATDESSAVFTSKQAILDAITGSITRSQLTSDLLTRIEYADRWYESDEIIESMNDYVEPTYFRTPLQWGIAQIEVNTSNISTLVTSLDGAWAEINVQAGEIDSIVSDVEGNSSLVAQLANEYFVKVDANNRVSGFGLYNAEEESQFVILADKFAIIKPDGTGSVQVPFVVDGTTGTVGIAGNLITTGSVTAGKLAADSVVASNIDVSTLSAISANLGTITAGTIRSTNWSTTAGCEIALSNGTFKFGGSSSPKFSWDGTDIDLNTGGELSISQGGDIRLAGHDSNAAQILLDGSSYDSTLYASTSGGIVYLKPLTNGVVSLFLGTATYNFSNIFGLAKDYLNFTVNDGTDAAVIELDNSSHAKVTLAASDDGGAGIVEVRGGDYPTYGKCFQPGEDNSHKLGTTAKRWSAVYAANGTIQTSDERDKERITDLNLGLEFILKLRPVSYSWLGQLQVHHGLIAQEVASALAVEEAAGDQLAGGCPFGALDYDPASDRYGLNYAEFVAPLVKAVQELAEANQELESRLSALEQSK